MTMIDRVHLRLQITTLEQSSRYIGDRSSKKAERLWASVHTYGTVSFDFSMASTNQQNDSC